MTVTLNCDISSVTLAVAWNVGLCVCFLSLQQTMSLAWCIVFYGLSESNGSLDSLEVLAAVGGGSDRSWGGGEGRRIGKGGGVCKSMPSPAGRAEKGKRVHWYIYIYIVILLYSHWVTYFTGLGCLLALLPKTGFNPSWTTPACASVHCWTRPTSQNTFRN